MPIDRRTLVIAGVAAAGFSGRAMAAEGDEMTIGAANAPVHLIEYASATCSHCAAFHEENWATLKADFVDAGKVRLTLREMATQPPQVAFAMFQLARGGGADANEYFRRLAILFHEQGAILGTGTMLGVRDALIALGAGWGMSQEQVMAAITDQVGVDRITRSIEEATQRGVSTTPTFFLNGERQDSGDFHTVAGMSRILNAAAG